MMDIPALSAHLAPNTVRQLERAAANRFGEAELLEKQNRWLGALYLYGYSVEMCLAAAYFRSAGFSLTQEIEDGERTRRMAAARRQSHPDGAPLMSNAPHPLDGWARLLQWHRQSSGALTVQDEQRLAEAVQRAKCIYKHWRPELRYKTTNVTRNQLNEAHWCVSWFLAQRGRL
jgi:hypothetical protein